MTSKRKAGRSRRPRDTVPLPAPAPAPARSSWWGQWLLPLVVVVTIAAFLPSLQNGFVDFDDDRALLLNPHYRGLGWANLHWMFTTFSMGHYQPLSWVTLGVDHLLWGMAPWGYHLTSLLLHASNGVLFYFIGLRLMRAAFASPTRSSEWGLRAAAAVSALLFAIHPLRVESVAWVTERRDVLSGLFFLATILCYLRGHTSPLEPRARRRWTGFALGFYVLSLLSKAGGMMLPVVLVVLDVYPLRRLRGGVTSWFSAEARRVWWEKCLYLVPAVVFAGVAWLAQHESGAMKPWRARDVLPRLAQAAFGLAFYLWKTIVPMNLAALYEDPGRVDPWTSPYLLSAVVVLAVTATVVVFRHRWPAGLASWVYYVVLLAPVLGLAQSGPQLVADRYSYLSCLSWPVLAGAGLLWVWRRSDVQRAPLRGWGLATLSTAVLLVLGVLTWRQTETWHDSETLWRHALDVGQESSIAHYDLGVALSRRGQTEAAIAEMRRALEIQPLSVDANEGLGLLLQQRGEFEAAAKHFRRVLEVNPGDPTARTNLGLALVSQGDARQAVALFREALATDGRLPTARFGLGMALEREGRTDEAMKEYREALGLDPGNSDARNNLALLLQRRGELEAAADQFRQIIETTPRYARARNNLGNLLFQQGRTEEAAEQFKAAVAIDPRYAKGWLNLGVVQEKQGKLGEAERSYREAVQLDPGFAEAHENLSRVLVQQGKEEEAARHRAQAQELVKRRNTGASH
ncbi:MAG TPA: tetratricopeptide repeat protein [Candidatus Methylomirabilis sp.]|nr:tetratricopeptide repeat protein [Candidatus Methylomirabilis sp.]